MGRLQDEQKREFIKTVRELGLIKSLADRNLPLEKKIEPAINYIEEMQDETEHYHSLSMSLLPMLQISHWLDDYCELIIGFDRRDKIDLNQVLSPSFDPAQQGGGISAPSLVKTLGMGICFLLRELMRQGILQNSSVKPHCYLPRERVRYLLKEIGMDWDVVGRVSLATNSRYIYEFISRFLGEEDATFNNCYDLPLDILASNAELKENVFQGKW